MKNDLSTLIKRDAELTEAALERYLSGVDARVPVIGDAMRYAVLGGGKRIRPFLAIEFCRAAGGSPDDVMPFACALEMIHSYSLVHDDLPCMDNDDLRRGKPTTHKKFGYANALLAGDALLTLAFEAASRAGNPADIKCEAVKLLSARAGVNGMCGGQMLDLYGETHDTDFDTLVFLHSLKTGALISCACELGCVCAGKREGDPFYTAALEYARGIGVTFQIVDDILDVVGDESVFGKPIGSDAEQGKTTYLSFMTIGDARARARELTDRACAAISPYDGDGVLRDFAEYLCTRDR